MKISIEKKFFKTKKIIMIKKIKIKFKKYIYKNFKKNHIVYFKISSNIVGNEVKLCVMGLPFPHI